MPSLITHPGRHRRPLDKRFPYRVLVLTDQTGQIPPLPSVKRARHGVAVVLRDYEDKQPAKSIKTRVIQGQALGLRLILAARTRAPGVRGIIGFHRPRWIANQRKPYRYQGGCKRKATASVHSLNELRRALVQGADAMLISPVFPTESHRTATNLGPFRASAWARLNPRPSFALGGISHRKAKRLSKRWFQGIAGISLGRLQ